MSRQVIAFSYVLKNPEGTILDQADNNDPLPFLVGAGQIIPKLEEALLKMTEGQKATVAIDAEDAYGIHDPEMLMNVPKEELAHIPVQVGSHLRLEMGGEEQIVQVIEIGDDHVVLDGNHPLAGVNLTFDVQLISKRDATLEELTHGHAHGVHGNEGHKH